MNWLNNVFNNITVTGNVEFNDGFLSNGDGTFTDTPGLFLYGPGVPAAGNLIYSVSSDPGQDVFGNNYLGGGATSYDNVNAVACTNQGATLQFYTMNSFNPGATFSAGGFINNINSTPFLQITNPVIVDAFSQGTVVELDGDSGSSCSVNVDTSGVLEFVATNTIGANDGNRYRCGQTFYPATGVSIGNTTTVIKTWPVGVGPIYDIYIRMGYHGNQNAGLPVIGWHGSAITPEASYGYVQMGFVQEAVYNNAVPGDVTGPVLQNGGSQLYEARFRYALPATQIGSLSFAAKVSGAGDTMVIDFCDIFMRVLSQ